VARSNPQILRLALLGAFVAVAVAVAVSLRRPPSPPPRTPTSTGVASGTTADELVYRKIVDGKERYVVKAKAMLGQEQEGTRLRLVEATFPHVYEGKEEQTLITADECVYDAEKQKATFTGHVKVTTTEGLEVMTESLVYNGTKGTARSDEHVDFARGRLSGSSTGVLYRGEGGELSFEKDVYLKIENETGPPTEIRGGRATASKAEAMIRFADGVVITQGNDQVKSQKLNLNLSPDMQYVYRAVFLDDMELKTAGRAAGGRTQSPAASFSGGSGRVLRSRKLDVWFHENSRELREAVAVPDASLLIEPTARTEGHRLAARTLTFRFDEAGRLTELAGQQGVVLTTSPAGGKGTSRTVKSAGVVARTDPATGEIAASEFGGGVDIVEGQRHATAQTARYDEARKTLALSGDARVLDPGQGSDLRAEAIDVDGKTGNLAARENVRHQIERRARPGAPSGTPSPGRPWQIASRFLDYDAAAKAGRYRENALLRADDDEVRAAVLVLEEPKAGQRRLVGSGGVVSILHPRTRPEGAQGRGEPVETKSANLLYEEEKRTVVYTGDVHVRQGDIATVSPQATAFLSADATRIESIVAGEPVEVKQGIRQAKGTKGTYTPANETMLLVGDKVTLEEGDKQRLQGRSLTFHSRDDRILVDGREVERTESVFRREPVRP
jgi:LPS export ABC transporter protein LptC/lipopolysaccharide transport protein LptA